MSIHITKNRIRATGADANGLLIALASDEQVLEWERTKHGGEQFQKMVKEAVSARGLSPGLPVEIFEKDNSITDLFNQEAERMKNAPKVWVEPMVVFPKNMGDNVRAVESE